MGSLSFPTSEVNILIPTDMVNIKRLRDTADFLRRALVSDHLRAPRIQYALAVVEADLADLQDRKRGRGRGWGA